MAVDVIKLLDDIIQAQSEYARVHRQTISTRRYDLSQEQKAFAHDDLFNEVLRESDLEHIGHLPMLATIVHPHLEKSAEVDLGKALVYLAIHETPERIVGDMLHDNKTEDYHQKELAAAQELLSGPYAHYWELYQDFHHLKNIHAQFAHSMDRLSAIVYNAFLRPEIRIPMWQKLDLSVEKLLKNTAGYMTWDKTLESLFDYVVAEIKRQHQEFKS